MIFITGKFRIPAGVIFIWSTDTAPNGWFLCYGQAVSRTTYAKLFGVIGTTYGVGDGSTTFNLPDMRGRIPVGKDNMGGVSANRMVNAQADIIGGSSGAENHTLTQAQMPVHTHTVPDWLGGGANGAGRGLSDRIDISVNTVNTGSRGGGSAHNNAQPYLTNNYIIKY